MITVKLSELMNAMADGGYAVSFNEQRIIQKMSSEKESEIFIPQVSTDKLYGEFIEMQNFSNDILERFGVKRRENDPLFLINDSNSSCYSDFAQAAFDMLDQYELSLVVSNYFQMRIAGLARKWASDNGLNLEEDFWNSNI